MAKIIWKEAADDYKKKESGSNSSGAGKSGSLTWKQAADEHSKYDADGYKALGQQRIAQRQKSISDKSSGFTEDKDGRETVKNWIDRYNKVIKGITEYNTTRNGGYTLDASGGFSADLDSLISDFEAMKPHSYHYGVANPHKYLKQLEDIRDYVSATNAEMSKYTEDEYNEVLKSIKEYEHQKNMDIPSAEQEISALEAELEDYTWNYEIDWTNPTERIAFDQHIKDQENLIAEKKRNLQRAKQIQDGIQLSSAAENADFGDYSGYVSTRDDTLGRFKSQYGMGYGDLVYEYINNQDGIREEIDQKQTVASGTIFDDRSGSFKDKGYDLLTEDEVGVYNYYYAKEGKEKAQQYLDNIQETLKVRRATGISGKIEDKTALELAFGMAAGIDQFKSGYENLFNTDDDYIEPSVLQMASQMVRQDLADVGPKLPDWMGGASLGQAGYDAVTTTANMAPSIMISMGLGMLNPLAGQAAGTALMGASAAGNAYQEALNMGYDKGQARAYSALVGGSEAGLQYLLGGIGKLGGVVSDDILAKILSGVDNAFARTAIQVGGNMLSESFEEGLQEILTPWFQNLALHANENVNWSEVAYSTLLGALTAGVMEGPGTVAGEVKNYQTGRQLDAAGISAARIADIGKTFSADTVAYKLAGKVDENTGAYTIGRLFNEIGATLTEQNINDIAGVLVTKGMTEATAKSNARVMARVVEGETLTDRQIIIIEGNEVLAEAMRSTIIDPNATWFQRTNNYNEVLKQRQNASRTNPAKQTAQNTPSGNTVDTENKSAAQSDTEGSEARTEPYGVKKISAINKGKARITLDDNTEVDVRDADISPDDGVRIETIAGIDGISAEDANFILSILKANPGANAQVDSLGAKEAYKYGFYNMSKEHMVKHGVFANSLTESQREAIYAAGQKARENVPAEVKKGSVRGKTAGVYFDAGGGKVTEYRSADQKALTDKQSAGVKTAMVLRKLGIGGDIYFFESYRNKDGKLVYRNSRGREVAAPNGWYSEKDGSIHIDLNAGAGGNGFVLFTLSHELTHFIEQWSPQKYKALADFLTREYEKGESMDKRVRAKQALLSEARGKSVSYKEAYSEVIADSMEAMLADGNVLEKLTRLKAQDKSLFDKMKEFFDNLAAKIRNVYKGMTPDSAEGRAVLEMKDKVDELQQLFAEALVDASKNLQNADGQKDTAHKERQFSDRYPSSKITEQDRAYLDAVNRGDMVAAQRMVDEAAKQWGAFLNNSQANEVFHQNGDVRTFYHGTNTGEFTVFDKELLGNSSGDLGWFGKGFYFAFSADEAETYGKRVVNAYLRMKNPYDYSQLYKFKGSNGGDSRYSRFAWLYNIVKQFPDIVTGQKVYAYPNDTDDGKAVSWKQLAGWMDRLEREAKFSVAQVELSNGETAWELRANPKQESFTNDDGETFTWTEYGMRQMFATERDAKKPINQIGAYLVNVMGVEPVARRAIEKIDFSGAVQKAGYDGILQSPSGDEAVVFDPSQIKLTDPVTYDDNGNVIPLSQRFSESKDDIRYSDRIKSNEYGGIREVLAKKGLDELSVKLGDRFPLAAKFDETMRNDGTKLVMEDVAANSVVKGRKESAYKVGRKAFTSKYGVKTRVRIAQMGIDADLYADVANESISKAIGQANEQSTLDVIPHVGDILSNSILMGVERIAHTDNKGTALYGYRLYNLYWYVDGNKKTPHALVCTVVQDLNKAEGYVFKNIENVTIGRGLPGANAGMSSSVNGDTYTIAQLYDAVKKIDRNSGGLKYTTDEKNKYLFSYTERNDGTLYQDRPSESLSNRSLLANALEGVAKTELEKKKIQEYRDKIQQAEAEEENLRAINEQLKVETDPKAMRELQLTAKQAANRINIYDKQLLRLEATKPIQDVLTREKKKSYDQGVQKGKDALQAYKERAEQKQAETVKRYQDARERGIENRQKTALRQKIRKVIRDLDKILNRGNKKRNVKEDIKDFVAEALQSAEILFTDSYSNEDMVMNGVQTEMTKEEAKLMAEAKQILDEIRSMPTGYEGWQARQEKEAKLKGRLAYRMGKLKDVFARERARLNKTQVSAVLGSLADAYKSLESSEHDYVRDAFHDNVYQYLIQLKEDIGGTIVRDMSIEQLEELYKGYQMVMTTVQNANRMFAENLNATRDALAGNVMREVKAAGGEHGLWTKAGEKVNQFLWNNQKAVYAFEWIGSETLKKLYGNIRKGQDTWAVDMQEANAFRQEMYRKYNRKEWDFDKEYKFKSSFDEEFSLNLEQILSLYAYSRREQAHEHLLKGGFVFDGNTEVVVNKHGIKRTYLNKSATAYNLSMGVYEQIISTLTDEQKAFVEEMQGYLSDTMGNKGNDVSMQIYGVKLFNEKYYFPLRSAGQYMERAKEADLKKEQGQINIVNSGFAKATKIRASNPVVLSGFMDVWADHVNEMSMYHSFVLPMEDFRRVYNYSTPHMEETASSSVNQVIENAYGSAATAYIDQLYRDLNGGALVDPRENLWKNMVGKFKKAAVFASASVTIQQPSAIGRAFAYINPKYFIGAKVDAKRHKLLWAEVKKYAPVAFIKEMGYFDTGMGQSAKDYLTSEEYTGIKDKVKAMFSDEGFRDEALGKLPGLADEITWCAIWEAVKRETRAKHPGMDVKSDAFLRIAGDRFSEVIDKTQVYDSVLARSANMRAKGTFMAIATSFLAEPTTSINMMEDAIRKYRKGGKENKKFADDAMGAVFISVLLNSLLVSFVYAARDDDDDETYLEKYTSSFVTEMLDGINPVTYYPFLKDIWSSLQGYDIERSDMSLITALVDSTQKVFDVMTKDTYGMTEEEYNEHQKNIATAMWGVVDSISSLMGIPVKNLRRDINGGINLFKTIDADLHDRDTSLSSMTDELQETMANAVPIIGKKLFGETRAEKLYDAILSGDTAYADRLKKNYRDENAVLSVLTSEVKKRFMQREITAREATSNLFDFGMEVNDAMWKVDEWQYELDTGSAEGYSKYKEWFDAIEAGEDLAPTVQKYLDGGVKEETLRSQITDHFKPKYVAMTEADRAEFKPKLEAALLASGTDKWNLEDVIMEWDFEAKYGASYDNMVDAFKDGEFSREDMHNILIVRGYDADEADKKLNEWEFTAKYGFSYSEREDGYKEGLISAHEMHEALMKIGGKTQEEADQLIEAFEYLKAHPDVNVYASRVVYWQRDIEDLGYSIEDTGMSLDTYLSEYDAVKDFTADKDEQGNSIPYSKINKAFPYINSLDLTPEQKTALAVACGWSIKTVNKNRLW